MDVAEAVTPGTHLSPLLVSSPVHSALSAKLGPPILSLSVWSLIDAFEFRDRPHEPRDEHVLSRRDALERLQPAYRAGGLRSRSQSTHRNGCLPGLCREP